MDILKNIGEIHGSYDGKEIEVISNETETLLIDGVEVKKEASREVWPTDGTHMEYTIYIRNNTGTNIENTTFEDEIDTTWVTLVEDSVYVDDELASYTFENGKLTVQLGTISTEEIKITFEVKRVFAD